MAIIGAGTMGRALAQGILKSGIVAPDDLYLASRTVADAHQLAAELGARCTTSEEACRAADVVLLSVKPKDLGPLLAHLTETGALGRAPLLISIAAGVAIAAMEAIVGACPVIRAMPNTPCRVAQGMTVLAPGPHATSDHLLVASEIFAGVGRCLVLDERHLDAVTAVSASGPAFVYLIIEALADGGVMCGLTRDVATELVAQMALGAAAMVLTTGRHPAQLKDDVTTPGGCTIAGLLALEDRQVRSALAHAVRTTTHAAAGLSR